MAGKEEGKERESGRESHYFTRHVFVMHRVITHIVMLGQQV